MDSLLLTAILNDQARRENLGGPGSGNYGHEGRQGEVGGSGPGAGKPPDYSAPGSYVAAYNQQTDSIRALLVRYGEAGLNGYDNVDSYLDDDGVRSAVKADIVEKIGTELYKQSEVDPNLEGAMRDVVNDALKEWSATSGDSSNYAIAMQIAAKDQFGLASEPMINRGTAMPGSTEDRQREFIWKEAQELDHFNGYRNRQMLQIMYNQTQKELADSHVEKLTLYRGMGWYGPSFSGDQRNTVPAEIRQLGHMGEGDFRISSQPMSSWSLDKNVAASFSGHGNTKVILTMEVPASRVLSTARSGFGCLPEKEVVLLSHSHDVAHVERY